MHLVKANDFIRIIITHWEYIDPDTICPPVVSFIVTTKSIPSVKRWSIVFGSWLIHSSNQYLLAAADSEDEETNILKVLPIYLYISSCKAGSKL